MEGKIFQEIKATVDESGEIVISEALPQPVAAEA